VLALPTIECALFGSYARTIYVEPIDGGLSPYPCRPRARRPAPAWTRCP